ncbi:SpaA isopeptide-forming pilin-related protein [Helcococcus kunzii]|uniref:SpaA isopeptide-forming pilin-related protein n=1 Tax=Helcococcus kunzii TaxID=40091 RepID=UPI0024AE27F8|nr:SpaA isopeptide-forming pilin-related protein [Helcococcus kunzii]
MRNRFKKISTILLAMLLVFQICVGPVQALQSREILKSDSAKNIGDVEKSKDLGKNNQSEIESKDEEKDSQTIILTEDAKKDIETKRDDSSVETKDKSTLDESKDKKIEKNVEHSNEKNNTESKSNDSSKIDEKLTKDQMEAAKDLDKSKSVVYKQPKVDYEIGEKIDLSAIEILIKNEKDEIQLLTYKDLISNKDIKLNHSQDELISYNYYNALFDKEYLKFESKETVKEIEKYLEKNKIEKYEPKLTIQIPNHEMITIDFNVKKSEIELSPLELFRALKMKNSSVVLLSADKLTYKTNEEINLKNFTFLLKDANGYLKLLQGKDLGKENVEIDYSMIKKEKEAFLKTDRSFTKSEKKPSQTFITVSKKSYEKLYIPITLITDDIEVKSVDKGSKVESINWGVKLDDKKSIFTYTLDVKSLDDLKEINLEFLNNVDRISSHIKISRIVKTNGYYEEDISLTDPIFRDKEHISNYKDMSTNEIINEMKKLDISNPVDLSNNLDPGYKYVFFIEINNNLEGPSKASKIFNELLISTKIKTFDKPNLKINIEEQEILEKAISIEEAKSPLLLKVEDTKNTDGEGDKENTAKNQTLLPDVLTILPDFLKEDNKFNLIKETNINDSENKSRLDLRLFSRERDPFMLSAKSAPLGISPKFDFLRLGIGFPYFNQILDVEINQEVVEVHDQDNGGVNEYVDYIDWTFTIKYNDSSSYSSIHATPEQRHLWHSFTITGDSGLGTPKVISINRIEKSTGTSTDLLNGSNYKNYVSTTYNDTGNDFQSITYRDGFPINNVDPTKYIEQIVVRTPVIRFQYDYHIDYHISADINKTTIDSTGAAHKVGLQELHRTKSIHKMEATTYRGEVIDTSYIYLDSAGNVKPTDTMNTIPTGDLAIARSVTGRYIAPDKIKWQVSDRNLTQKDITSAIQQNGLVDDSQTIDSVTATLYKPENILNATSAVGNKYTRSGQTSAYQQTLKPGQIAYYEVITTVKSDKETVEHTFSTGKKPVEAKLNGVKKPIVINKFWSGVPAESKIDTKYKILEDGKTTEATITKDKTKYTSDPVLVYQKPLNTNGGEDWTLNRSRPLNPLIREVTEDTDYLATATGPNGEKYKLYNSSSNNEQNTYSFTNGFEKKAGDYGITKINPMEQNQFELPPEPGRGRTYGWAGAVSGELKVPKGFKVGEYINLEISDKLTLAAVTDPNKPLFKIIDKDNGEVLFNIYKVSDNDLRFVATDYLEQKAKTRDVTANWMVGEPWIIDNNNTLINGKLAPQGTKIERGFSIDQNNALDYNDPNNIFKANNSGLNGVTTGIATFKSLLSTYPSVVKEVQGGLKIHFEASFDETLMKKFDNKVISDVNEDGKRKVTWRIVSNEGKYKLLRSGKQTDTIMRDQLSTQTDKTRLWKVGSGDQTLQSFRAYIATRANEIGGFDPTSLESIPVYRTTPTGLAAKSKYLLIQNLPTNPSSYNSSFNFTAKNLDPNDTLVIDFDVEFIHSRLSPERKGQISNSITINPRPSGGTLNLLSYYSTFRGSGTAAFDNTQSFEISKMTILNGKEVSITSDTAEFVLYKVENGIRNAIMRKSTDSTGKATFDNLTPGDYVLVESKAPRGYNISTAEYNITVTDTGISMNGQLGSNFNIINTKEEIPKYGEFTLTKVDSQSNTNLPGAIFSLTDSNGTITNFKTNNNGNIHFKNLKPGLYELKETTAPEGYELTTKVWSVYVNSEGKTFITELGEVAPKPGDTQGVDITDKVKLTGTLDFNDNADGKSGNNRLEMGTEENNITIDMDLKVNGFVNPGDYFTLKESDTLHYNMLQPDKMNYPSIRDERGNVLAYPTYSTNFNINNGSEKEINYVFTEKVARIENLNMVMKWSHSVNLNYVPNTGTYKFSVSLGDTNISKDISIAYKGPQTHGNLNVDANYLYTNDQNGRYTQIGYINPKRYILSGESLINIYPAAVKGMFNLADIGSGKTKISLYKFNDGTTVPNAVIFEKDKLTLVDPRQYTVVYTTKVENGVTVPLAQIKLNDIGTSTYLVKVDSEMKFPESGNSLPTLLGQYIELVNSSTVVRRSTAISTNTSDGAGTGTGVYTLPTLKVENTKRVDKTGKFELIKTDEEGNTFLQGAQFTLKPISSDGTEITRSSGLDGKIQFDNLKPGLYELVETLAPEGYIKSDRTWSVKVDVNGVTTVMDKVQPVGLAPKSISKESISLRDLFMNTLRVPKSVMALQSGTQISDVKIGNIGTTNYENSTVTTSAKYLGNDEFEVKLDIIAGANIGLKGKDADIVFLISGQHFSREAKQALLDKLATYGDNVQVGLKIYYNTTTNDTLLYLGTPNEAINAINNHRGLGISGSEVTVENAFKSAKTILDRSTRNVKKQIVHITGAGVNPKSTRIKKTISALGGINVQNYFVGIPQSASINILNWNSVLSVSTINASTNTSTIIQNNLPNYGKTTLKKAVENGIFKVTFNNNFAFVGSSTDTYKANPQGGKWHLTYSNGEIILDTRNGELSLNAGQTATMNFRVKSNSTITTGKEYKLINDIIFKPNVNVAQSTIPSPTVTLTEDKTFNVTVDWQGLTPIGEIYGKISSGETIPLNANNGYSFKDSAKNADNLVLVSATGPNGYKFEVKGSSPSYTIVVTKALTETPSLQVVNEKEKNKANLIIQKTDQTGENKLDGAIFELTGQDNYKKEQETKDGKVTFTELSPGEYTLREKQAPTGYEKTDYYWKINVSEKGKVTITPILETNNINTREIQLEDKGDNTFEYSIKNTAKKYNVEFVKYGRESLEDSSKDKSLQNVEFELFMKSKSGEFIDSKIKVKSDYYGKVKINNIYPGEYELRELYAPEGYRLIEGAAKSFRINIDGTVEVKTAEGKYVPNTGEASKIINLKSGTEKFSIIKKDSLGTVLKGVKFELRDSNGAIVSTKETDGQGKITFDNLPFGKYWLTEIKTIDGYVLDSTTRPILLGQKWEVPEDLSGSKDVSSEILLNPEKRSSIVSTEDNPNVVYPNKTEGLIAKLNLFVKPNSNIKPGDTFVLKLNENLDLDGIGHVKDEEFDIIAPSGRLAVAKINSDRRSITYRFTTYLENYKLSSFNINTPMFINRMLVPNNTQNVSVSIGVGNAIFYDTINVDYAPYNSPEQNNTYIKSYMTKFNPKTGEFTAVLYVNPQRVQDFNRFVYFWSDQGMQINSIKSYVANYNLPWSYGIDFSSQQGLKKYGLNPINPRFYYNNRIGKHTIELGNYWDNRTYVIKIDGKALEEGKDFNTHSSYERNYGNGYYIDQWNTWVNFYSPEVGGEGIMEINLINNKNKIEFTKVDGNIAVQQPTRNEDVEVNTAVNNPLTYLSDAEFQLKVKKGNQWEVYGDIVTSDKTGNFSWEGIPTGEYQVWEVTAPEGYVLPNTYVSSFRVDEDGNIVDVLNGTYIIPNMKEDMKFYIDKIWKNEKSAEHRIESGILEFELKAPEGKTFPNDVRADDENEEITSRKYRITKVSEDRTTITLEMDLKTAYEGINAEDDLSRGIKIIVPSDWASGDYTLKETKAPAGFILGKDKYTISIDQKNRTIKSGDTVLYAKGENSEVLNPLKIVNEKGKYPLTGGNGTLYYYLISSIMMLMSLLMIVRKKVNEIDG